MISQSSNDLGKHSSQDQTKHMITTDSHNAIHIKLTSHIQNEQFIQRITEMQFLQRKNSHKAIWVHLNETNLCHIQFLLQHDFVIHRGYKNQVSMYKWTAQHKDSVPMFSRFYVGCGACIIKDNKVFVVEEKSGQRKGYFGLPGGRADPGELISQATERQLFEETGIKAKFQYILYFRQLPKSLWNSSDIYFVSLLEPQENSLNEIKLCQNQIASYKWIPLEQFEDFMSKYAFGTQVHFSKHLTELHRKGYDFSKKSNLTEQKIYRAGSKNIMVEHIVTGVHLFQNPKEETNQIQLNKSD